ncbi:MAG TPA: polysaccharide deacetylase, partial [Bacillota bacterium]
QDPDRGTLLARVLDRAGPGSLVLMHPRAVTVDALPDLVRGLRSRGLEPVPLGTLLDPQYPPDPTTPDLPTGPTVRRPAGPGA